MTAIVGMAMGHRPIPNQPPMDAHTANFLLNAGCNAVVRPVSTTSRWKTNVFTLATLSLVEIDLKGSLYKCLTCAYM